MTDYIVNIETQIGVGIFSGVYLLFLIRATVKANLDLYDFFLLSTLSMVPAIFTYFSDITTSFGKLLGVSFPFVLMFGCLFVVTFIMLHRLIVHVHMLQKKNKILIQELGILSEKIYGNSIG